MGTHLFEDAPKLLEGYKVQMGKLVTLVAQKAALAGGDYLARETPVDTGAARSNWVLTVGAPFEGLLPAYVPYPSYRTNHHEAVKQVSIRTRGSRVRIRRTIGGFNGGRA